MEHLPQVGWADVATKRDLDAVSTALRAEIVYGFQVQRAENARDQRDLAVVLMVASPTLFGLAFAAVAALV